jgi:alkylation response protein AidB-like acyl-CoA dehydrogenase
MVLRIRLRSTAPADVDFDDTPEEAAWRARCRAFLDQHAERRRGSIDWAGSLWAKPASEEELEAQRVAAAEWQTLKFEHGWAGLTWPEAFGGRGLSSHFNAIFAEEEAAYDVPIGVYAQSIGMAGPTIIAHGTDAQKARYLEPMLRGVETWCQLFSEPGAGSDLAGLRTTGVVDGDEIIVNGQKVWTSNAVEAAHGMLLVRTDPDAPKHRGITYLLVDMSLPGIEVRPLRQINGRSEFNEVFLDDVRVPIDGVLGAIDAGWGPILTTLMNERQGIGTGMRGGSADLIEIAEAFGCVDDPNVRQELMRLHTMEQTIRFLGYRVRTAASRGVAPGPESSVLKLAASRRLELQGSLAMRVMGAAATLAGEDAHANGFWHNYAFLGQWAARIGGGTDQVQRNIVGENVLGLPQEPRPDKGVPFREIPAS